MKYIIKEENGKKITVRMLQERLIPLLKEIDRICTKHDIQYFLSDGTCLGAVRHKGFIPWDDDIDIGMSRNEYEKFLKVLDKELSDEYVYHCYEKSKKYTVTWPAMKIRIKNTYIKEQNVLLPNKCKDCDGIFIDVFIYDHQAKHRVFDIPLRTINVLLMPFIVLFEYIHINPIPLKALFLFNAKFYGKLCKNSEYFGDDITWVFNPLHPYRMKYSDVYPTTKLEFEGQMFPVPGNYHNYLVAKYGKNYITPVKTAKDCLHIKDINLESNKK